MEKVCYMIVITALVASFIILLLKKWGVTEWMQIHGDPISSRLFGCDFCMSFWTAVLILVFCAAYYNDGSLLLCAFCTTPITRLLV